MKGAIIIFDAANIKNFLGSWFDFSVYENDGVHNVLLLSAEPQIKVGSDIFLHH